MQHPGPWADTCPGLPEMCRVGRKDFLSVGSGALLFPWGRTWSQILSGRVGPVVVQKVFKPVDRGEIGLSWQYYIVEEKVSRVYLRWLAG